MDDAEFETDAVLPDDGKAAVDDRYIIPGLVRGMALLQLFTPDRPEQTLSEIAQGMGLSRSATYRLVYTLETIGFLRKLAETKRYGVTGLVLSLGFEYLHSQQIPEVAQPILRNLSQLTQAASHVIVLDGTDALHVARAAPQAALISNLQVGRRLPAHLTASGRVILAFTPEAELAEFYKAIPRDNMEFPVPASVGEFIDDLRADRERGYIFKQSFFEPAVSSIAHPILDRFGRPIAAINIVAPHSLYQRMGGEKVLAKIVGMSARELEFALGYRTSLEPAAD